MFGYMKKKINKNPPVAVIVLNYNGRHLLTESLGSLIKQTYSNFRLYLADGYSTDGSLEFVKKNFPQIEIILTPPKQGTALSSNYAVKRVKENFVVLTSNDMRFDKNCLKYLVETITSNDKIGICSSLYLRYKKDTKSKSYLLENAGGDLDIYGLGFPRDINKPFLNYPKKIQEVFFSFGGCFIIPRQLFLEIGGFDPRFITLTDDVDLSWRVRLLGYKIVVNPKAFLYHRRSATLGKLGMSKTRYFSERNILRMLLKNYAFWSLVKVLPRYFLLELGEIAFYLFCLRFDLACSIVRAIFWNIINLPDTLRMRSKVQKTRKVSDKVILKMLKHKSYKLHVLLPSLIRKKVV